MTVSDPSRAPAPDDAAPAAGAAAAPPVRLLARAEVVIPAYAAALIVAESTTTYINPSLGLMVHSVVLVALLVHTALVSGEVVQPILYALVIAPLIRLLSLSLPLEQFPVVSWYFIVSVPLFAAGYVVMRLADYTLKQAGFFIKLRALPFDLLVIMFGFLFGVLEYLILQPQPIVTWQLGDPWQALLLPALMILVGTGFMEEFVFRGIMQQTAERALGRSLAIIYGGVIFAILHIGWQSALDLVFVFTAGVFWGWVFARTRSIVAISISHGLTNIMLFLVLPGVVPYLPI